MSAIAGRAPSGGSGLPLRVARFAFAVLGVLALAWIPIRNIDVAAFSTADYFSYFTILSNVLAVVVLAGGAVADPRARPWQLLRGATTVYMVITGIIYAALLASVDVMLHDAWINAVLHRILPLVILLDWLLAPPRDRIADRASLAFLAFPLLYGAYTLIRGPFADWYPYPFLDPRESGYAQMAMGLAALLVAMVLMSLAVNAAGRIAGRWRYGSAPQGLDPAL